LLAQSHKEGQNHFRAKRHKEPIKLEKNKNYGPNSSHKTFVFLCAFATLREMPLTLTVIFTPRLRNRYNLALFFDSQLNEGVLFGMTIGTFKDPGVVPPGFGSPVNRIADAIDMTHPIEIFCTAALRTIQPHPPSGAGL